MTFPVSYYTVCDVITCQMSNVRDTAGNICERWGFIFPTKLSQPGGCSDQAVIQITANGRDDDWQDEAGSLICYLSPPIAVLAHQRGASNGSQNQHDLR